MGGEEFIFEFVGRYMGSCLWFVKGSSWSLSRSFGKPLGGLCGVYLGSVGQFVCLG